MKKLLVACEESQRVTAAFRAKGWKAFSCDIQEPSGGILNGISWVIACLC